MLYIFLVDTGSMMTFDMNLALQSVANLKTAIAIQCQIPEEKQVLLISGGESLNLSSRVCSYSSAGTDTSPIFLFSKIAIEASVPPTCVTDYGPDHDMSERVQSCIDMNPNYNTVVARAEMAQQLFEMAKQQLHNCERLVHDQHLQQQGWAAVVANLEDIATSFSNSALQLEDLFHHFVDDKSFYSNLLENFDDDIKMLAMIPILPALIPSESSSDGSSTDERVTTSLLEWISQKDNQNSLEQVAEHCLRGLEQFDLQQLLKIKGEVEEVLDSCNNCNMKEVKGLEERLYGLEKLMCEAKKIVDEQKDLAQAFYQNQTRASNLRDPSILPDLCASHQQQLQVMLKNHQKLRDYRRRCSRAKEELSGNLHARLRWIMFIEKKLSDIDAKILVYRENLRRLKKHLEVIHQIHLAPKIYMASVVEVVRRKSFSNVFIHWASSLARQSSQMIENEISMRQSFLSQLESHFLQYLFPGMNDFPPRFANDSPIVFDNDLPDLSCNDIEYLRNKLPDLSDMLVVPLPMAMPQPSLHECDTNLTLAQLKHFHKDSLEKQMSKSKPSESDTEEFETVNRESPKWQDSDTKLSSSVNDIDSPQTNKESNLSVTTDFLNDETNTDSKFKDVLNQTSITSTNIEELETQIEHFNKLLADKSHELIAIQESFDKNKDELNSAKNLVQSLLHFSNDLISTFNQFKASIRTQFTDISKEQLSTLVSFKDQLTDWLIMKEGLTVEKHNEFNKLINEYENRVIELNNTKESLSSEINIFRNTNEDNKRLIESLNKEIDNKNRELIKIKDENTETFNRMTLEHELEMTALNEELKKISQSKQDLEDILDDKNVQLDRMKHNNENLESQLLLRFQEEKDCLINELNSKAHEREQLLRDEYEEKMKTLETKSETIVSELRSNLTEEKSKSLMLVSGHKNEIEGLRHRFKIAISTTSIERTPSESSLEKVQLDIVDQSAQDREINKLKQIILEQNQSREELLFKLRKEKEDEIKIIRQKLLSTHQAEKQVTFNEALNKLTIERDLLSQELRKKQSTVLSSTALISDIISNITSIESNSMNEQIRDALNRIKDEITSLISSFTPNPNATSCDSSLCKCHSTILREKEIEISRLQQILRENEMTQSSSTIGRIERVAVLSCEVGDIVLVYYEEKFENFIIFSINNVLHFLHTDCLEALSLKSVSGEAHQRWTICEVTDKEYCQAKKHQNRYRVPLNTKFYRVKAKPWSRMNFLFNRFSENRSSFSASSTFSRNEAIVEPMMSMDMSSSTIPIDTSNSSSNRMSQSCLSTKSTK